MVSSFWMDAAFPPPRRAMSEMAIDLAATALFAGFVALLLLGSENPSVPYNALAVIPLFGSLGALFWANLREDRIHRLLPATWDQ